MIRRARCSHQAMGLHWIQGVKSAECSAVRGAREATRQRCDFGLNARGYARGATDASGSGRCSLHDLVQAARSPVRAFLAHERTRAARMFALPNLMRCLLCVQATAAAAQGGRAH